MREMEGGPEVGDLALNSAARVACFEPSGHVPPDPGGREFLRADAAQASLQGAHQCHHCAVVALGPARDALLAGEAEVLAVGIEQLADDDALGLEPDELVAVDLTEPSAVPSRAPRGESR